MPCDYLKMLTDMLDANGMSYKVEPSKASVYENVGAVVVELADVPEFSEFVQFTSGEYGTRLLVIRPTRDDEIFTCQQYNISSRILHNLSELLRTASTSDQPDDSVKLDFFRMLFTTGSMSDPAPIDMNTFQRCAKVFAYNTKCLIESMLSVIEQRKNDVFGEISQLAADKQVYDQKRIEYEQKCVEYETKITALMDRYEGYLADALHQAMDVASIKMIPAELICQE